MGTNDTNEDAPAEGMPEQSFSSSVGSIFFPGLFFGIVLYLIGQKTVGSLVLVVDVGFVAYLYYQRVGVAAKMTYKAGVSFNLRNMVLSPKNLLIQQRGIASLRFLVEKRDKASRVAERGGIAILLNCMRRFPDEKTLVLDVLKILRAISESSALSRRRIYHTFEFKTEMSLRAPSNFAGADSDDNDTVGPDDSDSLVVLSEIILLLGSLLAVPSVKDAARIDGVLAAVMSLLENNLSADNKLPFNCLYCLYEAQNSSNENKEYFARNNLFQIVLDCLRINRKKVELNTMGFMLLFETLFSASAADEDTSDKKMTFLPDVYAEAIEAGVFQALADTQKRHHGIAELATMLGVLRREMHKSREGNDDLNIVEM